MLDDEDPNFQWNWAELAELEQRQADALSSYFATHPFAQLCWQATRAEPPEAPLPADILSLRLHDFPVPGLEGLNFFECALLNPSPTAFSAWTRLWLALNPALADRHQALSALIKSSRAGSSLATVRVLLSAEANPNATDDFGNHSLLLLFESRDSILDIGGASLSQENPLSACCSELLAHGANPFHRNADGESPLSRIHLRLENMSIGLSDDKLRQDLLQCAQHLLDAGAPPSSVRVEPPLQKIISDPALLGLLESARERSELREVPRSSQSMSACPAESSRPSNSRRI